MTQQGAGIWKHRPKDEPGCSVCPERGGEFCQTVASDRHLVSGSHCVEGEGRARQQQVASCRRFRTHPARDQLRERRKRIDNSFGIDAVINGNPDLDRTLATEGISLSRNDNPGVQCVV